MLTSLRYVLLVTLPSITNIFFVSISLYVYHDHDGVDKLNNIKSTKYKANKTNDLK